MNTSACGGCICRRVMLLALLTVHPLFSAVAREFLIQNWTRGNGLPGITVTALAQTPDGYLWVGTFNGLARFDGVRFVRVELQKLAGLSDASVVSLHADREGSLWIGTADGHLVRQKGGTITSYLPPSRQTADRYIQRIAKDKAGGLWTLNYEGGLNRLVGNAFELQADRAEILGLTADLQGGLWVASRDGLLMLTGDRLERVWDASRETGFRPEALTAAREGGCWIITGGQAQRFDAGQIRAVRAIPQGKPAAVLGFLEDRAGSLWLGTYGEGVMVLGKDGTLRRLTREEGFPGNLVRCLFQDQEGNLWAGLEGKGLTRIRRAMFTSYGRAEGLSDETVFCVCEGRDGEVWIGTNGDGIYRIQGGQIRHFGMKEGLTNQFVWTLHQDRSGRVWAGTWGGGLFRLEGERFLDTSQELGPAPVVLALHEDARGALWLGQRVGPERRIESVEGGRRRLFSVPGSLPRLDVRTIAETSDGSLWFGTMEEGLLRWKNGVFIACSRDQGMLGRSVSALHVDDDGALWVGLEGVGLVLWERERFTPITAARELLDENLNQITDDGLGYLWCGLRSGVVRVGKAELRALARGESQRLEWRRFTSTDGLPSNECSGTGCRTRDGRIWFPTVSGVAVVDPHQVAVDSSPPPVLVEEVSLAGKRIPQIGPIRDSDGGAGNSGSSKSPAILAPDGGLRIAPGTGPLDIVFTALTFTAPDRVRFRYQLLGLDEAVVEAGGARSVRYNYLPHGQYRFDVTACNEGGAWNESGASLAFEVLPRYWQTWWFQLACICGVLGATVGAARWVVTRRLKRRMAALEQQRALEAERSRIAQDLHDDLGTSLTEINFLSAIAGSPSSSPTEVKGSLESINEKSLELVKALDEIVWAVNPKNDSLRNLVNYLCLFAQDFLRPTPIQCRLDVPSGLPDLPLNAEQRHTLFLVTKEALANAAKHSAASELWLRVTLDRSLLTLIIEDNGRGFELTAAKGDRNGLKNIETRMQDLGGRGMIQSAKDQGTRVALELPATAFLTQSGDG